MCYRRGATVQLTVFDVFWLCDAVRKCSLCCRLVAVRPSVCPFVCHVDIGCCIHMVEDNVKLLSWTGSPIILVFFIPIHCNCHLSRKWRVLRIKLVQHSNRKPYLTYQMIPCLVTLTDLQVRRSGLAALAELSVCLSISPVGKRYFVSPRKKMWRIGNKIHKNHLIT